MPPAVSKRQFRLMKGISEGTISPKGGLTKEKATEFISGQKPYGLPESAAKKGLKRLVSKVHKAYTGKRWKTK